MTHEEQKLYRLRQNRIARTKKWLRWLPRRSNIHRYPVLKWFTTAARKRSYLWSFRVGAVIPALYAGLILAFLPLYGVQIPLAFLLALMMRANLPILAGAQFITNPITVIPVYYSCFQIGRIVLHLIGIESPHLNRAEARTLFTGLSEGDWHSNLNYLSTILGVTSLGSIMLGLFTATVASLLYKAMAYEVTVSYNRLKHLQSRREKNNTTTLKDSPPDNID